jgi:predicted RNase H-like HicB family nuclease
MSTKSQRGEAQDAREGTVQKMVWLTYEFEREGDQVVSRCPELGVASCGDTIEDAQRHLEDAIFLYLNTLQEDGELDGVFRARGIEVDERLEADYDVGRVTPGVYRTAKRVAVGAA